MNKIQIQKLTSLIDDKCTYLNMNRVNSSKSDFEIDDEIKELMELQDELVVMYNEYIDFDKTIEKLKETIDDWYELEEVVNNGDYSKYIIRNRIKVLCKKLGIKEIIKK
jgi:diphthamide synthase (EF-2-diphthine--ammonia ligase)